MKRKYETRATSHEPQAAGHERRAASDETSAGSALILTVVLTSLLAIVGVLFVMVSRLDKMATSAVSENKELNLAVDTVIAKISQELVLDVPGAVDANEEYYDYPGPADSWLACLEPYQSGGNYYWRQISDIYGVLNVNAWDLPPDIVPDYQVPFQIGDSNTTDIYPADADGDGVSDSVWVMLPYMSSNKGKPIYAAVRIIDNGGMLNVNTAYKFDPCEINSDRIDGSSQMQINLFALSERGATNTIDQLDDARFGSELHILDNYIRDVVWRYNSPDGAYMPFDISDELELRNRFLLEFEHINTRIEKEVWTSAFTGKDYLHVPVDGTSSNLDDWFVRAQYDLSEPNKYSYRHIATTYNMDRIIQPDGKKMVNVNGIDDSNYLDELYQAIRDSGIDQATAAQIAVNIKDYIDTDPNVTVYNGYYGFERPCIYISEVAYNAVTAGDPPVTYKAFAIELYKPYSEDSISAQNTWQLVVAGTPINIGLWPAAGKDYYVIRSQEPNSPAEISVDETNAHLQNFTFEFVNDSQIILQRYVTGITDYIPVDSIKVPGWLVSGDGLRSLQRDINKHKCIRRLWDSIAKDPTLGIPNDYDSGSEPIQAHPYLDPNVYEGRGFKNVGEIGMVFTKSAYSEGPNSIGPNDIEATARLDLSKSVYQQIFNYLTVFDPNEHGWPASETRIKGRININTAPWFVLAQLPWISQKINQQLDYQLAQWIVRYREAVGGFKSICELNNVTSPLGNPILWIDYYARDSNDLDTFPDLTPNDDVGDDFEERDVIFSRISNLVTVRSDVFTAYILVRIGEDGPQKRVVAILDRSKVDSPDDKVKVRAIHPVPDPR